MSMKSKNISKATEPFLFQFLEKAEVAPEGQRLDTKSPEDKPRPPEPTKKTPWGD